MQPAEHRAGKPGRPALRLVSTHDMSRGDWLEVRKQGIGGSDAAAAVGLNPYKSQLELWLEKTGRDAEMRKPDPDDEAQPIYWGTLLEPIVAAHYTKRTGNRVRRVNAVTQYADHERRARSADHRLDSTWFGVGATLKQRAWEEALKLVA